MVFLMVSFGVEAAFHKGGGHGGDGHESLAYSIEIEEEDAGATEEEAEPEISLAALIAEADPASGEKVFKKCQSCHTIEEGGKDKTGPHLWGVMGREIASVAGFGYSGSLPAGETWDWEHLNAFLTKPADYAPGTSMAFGGLKKPTDRADLMAFLNENTATPLPAPAE